MSDMERLTMTSEKGGVAFTFDLDITCKPSEAQKILRLAEKLKHYEDMEEQGRLIELPCKVGDKVWLLKKKCKHAGENNQPWNHCNQYWTNVHNNGMWGCAGKNDKGEKIVCRNKEMELYAEQTEYNIVLYSPNVVLGENLFLTEAEAEAKLKELEGER